MTIRDSAHALISDRHSLGHADIDSDHFAIAECWLQAMRCSSMALPFHIARLRKLMRRHFENEVLLVAAAGASFCPCHRREHEAMLSLCDNAYELSQRAARRARALLRKLPRLVREHIISMDQIAVLIIHNAGQAQAADGLPAN